MVLDYLKVPFQYETLLKILKISPIGTPSFRIQELNQLGVHVTYSQTSITTIRQHIEAGHPGIAFIETGQLPYWTEAPTYHAVVVIGFDDQMLYVNDPFMDTAPQVIHEDEFILAWSEHDYRYALITK